MFTSTNAILYYYAARKLILVLPSPEGEKAEFQGVALAGYIRDGFYTLISYTQHHWDDCLGMIVPFDRAVIQQVKQRQVP